MLFEESVFQLVPTHVPIVMCWKNALCWEGVVHLRCFKERISEKVIALDLFQSRKQEFEVISLANSVWKAVAQSMNKRGA